MSLIVVTYNSAADINACLSAIDAFPRDTEVIVVDNASTDNTRELVSEHSRVRLVKCSTNAGFAAAVNVGIAESSAPYVMVLNPDVTTTCQVAVALCDELERHSDYGAIGCRMHYPDGSVQVSARPFPTVLSFLSRVIRTNHIAQKVASSSPVAALENASRELLPGEEVESVDWILGGLMLIRRTAYIEIGPFDENYFLYYEDIDWCFRAHLQSWKIGVVNRVHAVHDYKRASSRLVLTNRLLWIHLRSAARFFIKFFKVRGMSTWA